MSLTPTSVDINSRVDVVRKLISSTSLNKEQKQELAIGVRIDAQLSWGFAMHAVQDACVLGEVNFDYSHFESAIKSLSSSLSKPETVATLTKTIREKEEVTKDFRRKFTSIATTPDLVGNTIFESLTGEKPKGDVKLINTPLAIMIQIKEKTDYEKLGNRKSGGFYQSEAKIHKSFKDKSLLPESPFQLICVRNIDDETKKHEVRHGINMMFKQVLRKIGNTTYWSEGVDYSWGKWEQWFKDNHPKEHARLTENSRIPWYYNVWTSWLNASKLKGGSIRSYVDTELVPASLGRAKDEVIADFEASGNFDYLKNLLKSDLEFRDAMYDYLAEWFDSSLDWEANGVNWRVYASRKGNLWPYLDYQNGWINYTETLEKWVKKAEEIHDEYKNLGLTERVKIFGELLVQTPLDLHERSRPEDLNATLGKELDKVTELDSMIHRYSYRSKEALSIYTRRRMGEKNYYDNDDIVAMVEPHLQDEGYREILEKYQASFKTLKEQYRSALVSGQRSSLFPVVDEWRIHFDNLQKDYEKATSLPITDLVEQ